MNLFRHSFPIVAAIGIFASSIFGAFAAELTEASFRENGENWATVIVAANWGRNWNCASYRNTQLMELAFKPVDAVEAGDNVHAIELKSGSRLFVNPEFKAYGFLVPPGTYALSRFSIRAAQSMTNVGYVEADEAILIPAGKPQGGTFEANAGEIVYIGHFWVDCAEEPIPWRFYAQNASDYANYVKSLREQFPFIGTRKVVYRLFKTEHFGYDFSIE